MKYLFSFGWLCFLVLSCTVAQEGSKSIRSDDTRVINGKSYYVHHVKKRQTLYNIARAYNVEMEEIMTLNPEIRKGLKRGQALLIPKKGADGGPVGTDPSGEEPVPDTARWSEDRDRPDKGPCGIRPRAKKEVYNVALMMHLYLNELDSINTDSPDPEEVSQYNSFRYIQFYEGFMQAVEKLKQEGMNINLYVYDVETNESSTYRTLRKPEMAGMDLIIGMLFHRNFEIVSAWADEHDIPLISPISQREEQVDRNPMVIKVRPAISAIGTKIADYLSEHFPYAHTLIVNSYEPEMKRIANQLHTRCWEHRLDATLIEEEHLIEHLLPGAENVVVVVAGEKSYALEQLSQLNADTMGYDFTVFGLPRWEQFEGMDFEYLIKSRAHVTSTFYTDYNDPAVKQFVESFRQMYKTDPDMLAFQGFDVGWFFLNALMAYGKDFPKCMNELKLKPLQTDYRFRRNEGDGWENQFWYLIRYDYYRRTILD